MAAQEDSCSARPKLPPNLNQCSCRQFRIRVNNLVLVQKVQVCLECFKCNRPLMQAPAAHHPWHWHSWFGRPWNGCFTVRVRVRVYYRDRDRDGISSLLISGWRIISGHARGPAGKIPSGYCVRSDIVAWASPPAAGPGATAPRRGGHGAQAVMPTP